MIFVDTSAWYAVWVPSDDYATMARAWFDTKTEPLVTTDYVVDELLTLMRSRGANSTALTIGQRLWSGRYARIEYITHNDVAAAWDVFRRYDDKRWSFTDCTSRVVMERLGITTAFAFDDHFRQFQSVTVVP